MMHVKMLINFIHTMFYFASPIDPYNSKSWKLKLRREGSINPVDYLAIMPKVVAPDLGIWG